MNKYYFTYGTAEFYPYKGGWTIVHAENRQQACELFRIMHPDRIAGVLNCADYYSAEYFEKTECFQSGNGKGYTHEVIKLKVEKYHREWGDRT